MIIIKFIVTSLVALLACAILAFLVGTAYGWEKVWPRFFGNPDQGQVQFSTLTKTPKPNQALVCPEGYCVERHVDMTAPTYALSVEELRAAFLTSIEGEERLERVDDNNEPNRLRFVQRTKLMRFPDTINIEFLPQADGRSSLAVFSQSQIGTSDFGVNLARLERWLERLRQHEIASL
ncbi:MAG: DUF1499 domain-containing protein [Pseudomonadota bacterium]